MWCMCVANADHSDDSSPLVYAVGEEIVRSGAFGRHLVLQEVISQIGSENHHQHMHFARRFSSSEMTTINH